MARDHEYVPERGTTNALARRDDVADGTILTVDPISIRDNTFAKAGSRPLAKAMDRKLRAPIHPTNEADILPTGEIYMSHVHVRRRLNEAVGAMGWAIRPVSDLMQADNNQLTREFALIVLGRVVATAYGSAKYYPHNRQGGANPRADKADSAEMVKSNALTRCCKDLGIGSECWDRHWCDAWREKHAVHVRVRDNDEVKVYWRRIDQKPYKGEYAVVDDSPNQDRWRKQWSGWIEMVKKSVDASRAVAKEIEEIRKAAKSAGIETPGGKDAPARGGESRADGPNVDKSEPRTSGDRQTPPVAHGKLRPEDRQYKIMKCQILKRDEQYILYGIQMADGKVYTTFSSTMYERLGKHWAAGELVEIRSETKVTKGKEHQNIIEFGLRKGGAK